MKEQPEGHDQDPVAMGGWGLLGNGERGALASLASRLGARILDGIILVVVILTIALAGLGAAVVAGETGALAVVFFSFMAILVVTSLYETTMVAIRGQTLGKMAAGIKVVQVSNGEVPGWWKSVLRTLVLHLPGLVPVLGQIIMLAVLVSPLWDAQRQGWHDKAAATVVVKLY